MVVAERAVPEFVPASLGFPGAKFKAYRPAQISTALSMLESDKRFQMLSAPTGTGKGLCYLTLAQMMDARTLVLTGTKQLQQQMLADFREINLTDVRGQSNYRCVALDRGGILEGYGQPGSTCADGPCRVGVQCPLRKEGCDYYDSISAAADAQLVITNYSFWLAIVRHSDPTVIGQFDLLICDEAHGAESTLVDFCAVELERAELKSVLNLDLPAIDQGVDVWAGWARSAGAKARERAQGLRLELKQFGSDRRKLTKDLLRLTMLERSLAELARARAWRRTELPAKDVEVPGTANDWIAFETPKGAKFSPIWAHQYSEEYLFRGVPKVVLSSGTLLPSITKRLGIPPAQAHWHEVKSSFDPRRRPIIYVPTTRMDNRATDGQKRIWMNRIDRLLDDRLDRKTLIHSVSYDRAEYVKQHSRHAKHMLTHRSHETRATIEQFKRAKAPCILVSPAVTEGVDFPGDEVRFIIIAKVPFASSTDPVFKARCKADPDYRFECAALLMIQMAGRGMRAADDMVEVCVIDYHFNYLRYKTSWPQWFKASWKQSDGLPEPLKLTA